MSQEEEKIISSLREFVQAKEIESFSVQDFLDFYKGKQEVVSELPSSMKMCVRIAICTGDKVQVSDHQEEWTTTKFQITSPSLGTFEEFLKWRGYDGLGNRYFFQEKESDNWWRLRVCVIDGSVVGDLRRCISTVSQRYLLFNYNNDWDNLEWNVILTFQEVGKTFFVNKKQQ